MNEFTYLKDKDFSKGRRYIGASDVPTIALMNLKYGSTPLTLWEEKTGRSEGFKGNERTKAGHDLEPIVLRWGLEKLDYENWSPAQFIAQRALEKNMYQKLFSFTEARHPEYNFIVAHADMIESDQPFIMEAKTTGFFGGKRKDDLNYGYDKDDLTANGIPSSVYLQIQTQMLCYGIDTCYVSVMIDTGMHRLYGPIKKSVKHQEKIIAVCEKFWWHVENDKPPKPETWADVISLNPGLDKNSKTVIAGEKENEVMLMKSRKKWLTDQIKKLDSEKKDLTNAIGLIIGENAYLENSEGDSLAKAFEVTRYFLKDHKNMSKRRFNQLLKDGFISENISRQVRF